MNKWKKKFEEEKREKIDQNWSPLPWWMQQCKLSSLHFKCFFPLSNHHFHGLTLVFILHVFMSESRRRSIKFYWLWASSPSPFSCPFVSLWISISRASFIHPSWHTSLASAAVIYIQSFQTQTLDFQQHIWINPVLQFSKICLQRLKIIIADEFMHTHLLCLTFFSGQNSNCSFTSNGNMYPSWNVALLLLLNLHFPNLHWKLYNKYSNLVFKQQHPYLLFNWC